MKSQEGPEHELQEKGGTVWGLHGSFKVSARGKVGVRQGTDQCGDRFRGKEGRS